MARYIDAEAFKRKLIDEKNFFPSLVARAIDETPTANVAVVKHGVWIKEYKVISNVAGVETKAFVGFRCSLCNRAEFHDEPYCNCGAKMDGGKK